MKKITALLCASFILLSSSTAFCFSDKDPICEMDNLDRALCNAKTVEEIDDLLESAAPDLRAKYLQNTIDKLCCVMHTKTIA